jgi:hypothetical protein
MAKTPNYDFDRRERDRQKAAKKAEKLAAKANAREKPRENDAVETQSATNEAE